MCIPHFPYSFPKINKLSCSKDQLIYKFRINWYRIQKNENCITNSHTIIESRYYEVKKTPNGFIINNNTIKEI